MKTKASLDDLQLFHLTVQRGSLRAAAASLQIPIATLSRRLQKLEQSLGCRLLERSAHRFALTEMGRHYFAACGPLLDDLHAVTAQLDEAQHGLSGSLRVTAPVNLTQQRLGRCFFDFMRRYPHIRLDLLVSNQNENLIEQQIDAAIRVGEPAQDSWIARPIGQTHLGLCAAPAYLRREPPVEHPRDLLAHALVVANPMNRWELMRRDTQERFSVLPQPYFQSSDIGVALAAAAEGFGIVLVPNYYFSAMRDADAALVPVLPEWQGTPRPVHLLYRDRQAMSARLRAFVEHVIEWMQRQPE